MTIQTQTKKRAAHRLGLIAEDMAASYLHAQGYQILGKRVRSFAGEIDVLALLDDTLIIVEVKARKRQEEGLYSVTYHKQQRLIRATEALLAEGEKMTGLKDIASLNIRFDAIIISPNAPPLHIPNAWSVE